MIRPLSSLMPVALFCALLTLAACQSVPASQPAPPRFDFSDRVAYEFASRTLEIDEVYRSPAAAPHVEHIYTVEPADIARAWARDRLRLVGTTGGIVVRILEASVVEEALPTTGGLRGYLTNEQDRRYTARLRVELIITTPEGTGRVEGEATASRTLPESANVSAMELDYHALLDQLSRTFDAQLSTQVSAYLVGL